MPGAERVVLAEGEPGDDPGQHDRGPQPSAPAEHDEADEQRRDQRRAEVRGADEAPRGERPPQHGARDRDHEAAKARLCRRDARPDGAHVVAGTGQRVVGRPREDEDADRERHRQPWRPVADGDGRRIAIADQGRDAEDHEREPGRHRQHDEHLGAHEELDHDERPERDPDPDGAVAPSPEQLVEAGEDERRHDEGRDHEVRAGALEQHERAEGVERARDEGGERRANPALRDPHGGERPSTPVRATSATLSDAIGPKSAVTGSSTKLHAVTDVLESRLMPCGWNIAEE